MKGKRSIDIALHVNPADKFNFNLFISHRIKDIIKRDNTTKGAKIVKVEIRKAGKFTFALIHSTLNYKANAKIKMHRYHKIILHQSELFYKDSNVIDQDKFIEMPELVKIFNYFRKELNETKINF